MWNQLLLSGRNASGFGFGTADCISIDMYMRQALVGRYGEGDTPAALLVAAADAVGVSGSTAEVAAHQVVGELREIPAIPINLSLFLSQRFHRIDPGGSTRRNPCREQARHHNHHQAGEICDGIGDVHDRRNHRAGFGCENECRQ